MEYLVLRLLHKENDHSCFLFSCLGSARFIWILERGANGSDMFFILLSGLRRVRFSRRGKGVIFAWRYVFACP